MEKNSECKKIGFHTESFAKNRASEINASPEKKHLKRGQSMRSYKCLDCGKWHLTKLSRKVFNSNKPQEKQRKRVQEIAESYKQKNKWQD